MQEFSTADARHEFTVDGHKYFLPAVSIEDVQRLAELAKMNPTDQATRFKGMLQARVQPQSRTFMMWLRRTPAGPAAITAMSFPQLTALFNEWASMGRPVGESSGSPASQ